MGRNNITRIGERKATGRALGIGDVTGRRATAVHWGCMVGDHDTFDTTEKVGFFKTVIITYSLLSKVGLEFFDAELVNLLIHVVGAP